MPRVSVVIPTYNCAHYLAQAVDSALAQTYTDREVIVVDDGSTDATAEVAGRFGSEITYIRQPNRGLPAARNRAITASTGDLIALLDSDDWWEPEKLARQVERLDRDPETALVYTDLRVIYDNGAVLPSFLASRPLAGDGYVFTRLTESSFILPSTVLFRRSCLDEVGLFDESMRSHEDLELWLRLSRRFPVALIPEPLTNRRQGTQNMTADAGLRTEYGVTVCERALGIPGLSPAEREAVERKLGREHGERAYYLLGEGRGRECRASLAAARQHGIGGRRIWRMWLLSLVPSGLLAWGRRALRGRARDS